MHWASHCLKDRQDDVLDIVLSVSLKQTRSYKLEIEHKSLILAQMNAGGMLYTCKSDGSTEKLASWVASGERVSQHIGTYRAVGDN